MPYTLDGQPLNVSLEPQQNGGTLWVPLRPIGQALGGNVDWDPDNQVAILYLNSRIATVKMDDANVDVDGQQYALQEAPYVSDGESWVPVRFFNNPLGYALNVDLGSHQVDFTSPAA
ncbi:MAG: copper amine oxidase N-terminal domain-containing protein [Abitibacteriaceae bacterium]|nr:copper amine oxidase N-terminal domain-containing protein [Abditibacteriaceae bacterium]